MPQSTHIEIAEIEAERQPHLSPAAALEPAALRVHAAALADSLRWLPRVQAEHHFSQRWSQANLQLKPILKAAEEPLPENASDDLRWLHENIRLLETALQDVFSTLKPLETVPVARTAQSTEIPRVTALAEAFLEATGCNFSEESFTIYIEAFQKPHEHQTSSSANKATVLQMAELWALVPALKLALLENIVSRAQKVLQEKASAQGVGICMRSLHDLGQTTWKDVLEPLILFESVLRQDPAGAYAKMDFDSRDLYRNTVAKIAEQSGTNELDVARKAVALARKAAQIKHSDPRLALRRSHVGYYLLQEGRDVLNSRVGFRAPFATQVQSLLRKHPDWFYLSGISGVLLVILLAILIPTAQSFPALELFIFSLLLLLAPCSQAAVELMNYLTTSLLSPQILPKLDFSESIPDDCLTMVAVPTLLLNERQVRDMAEELEVRYLGNRDRNMHFALLTDLPDSAEQPNEDHLLVDLCASLVRQLNEKYGNVFGGSFFLFHRHRSYNPREGVWMGWERKRGKLLDLNKLLQGQDDHFPLKVGDLSLLPRVRFVITLDSDTKLPRGSAQRMIATMAHPLNQAIIDPQKNIVTAGYGILQPRVGVSVQSASQSRLANLYSGQTGLDIYTHAVSDVYQDLYGEAIFTGKGIYEVATLHRVLDRRFPRNALLSHDLIEGAYARVGLASDIEIIDDYPSHYSAYNRRKHRWVRGDWQITEWLSPVVPDEAGGRVHNPISLVSQWKILDNLRRSLVEPATFFLFFLGWLMLPAPVSYWTLAAIAILFIPAWCQFLFTLARAAIERSNSAAKDALKGLFTANVNVLLSLTFLPHQMLLSLDAIVRTLIRRKFTREKLLEWETAAEAELGKSRRTAVDTYLDWTPTMALAIALVLLIARPAALLTATPILLLWLSSKSVSLWLNRPPRSARSEAQPLDEVFLRCAALRTWRYFAEFSNEGHNWLIPDNVQETNAAIAARLSPTNLGMLFNARQAACEFGYLTLPEFATLTLRTLATVTALPRHHGHLLNWYDTRTLEPVGHKFVSAVDSGNLVASYWTLQQGCLDRLRQPVISQNQALGFLDHLRILYALRALPNDLPQLEQELEGKDWLVGMMMPKWNDSGFDELHRAAAKSKHATDAEWFVDAARARVAQLKQTIYNYAPWMLPEFSDLRADSTLASIQWDAVSLEQTPQFIKTLTLRLEQAITQNASQAKQHCELLALLPAVAENAERLIRDLKIIGSEAERFAREMDFRFLLHPRRKLLSIGFDVDAQQVHSACYDLLASEARMAVFTAVAKDDIPQEAWFLLGRGHRLESGHPVLVSWTGTMFEYLMPALWMRTYPNTLLDRSRVAAVQTQQDFAANKRMPWGISESAYAKTDEAGNYQYHAFGLPGLALHVDDLEPLVISPYSTFLSLDIDPAGSVANLRRMAKEGWCGPYGFYESADYTSHRKDADARYELVRCWMAHHQGMSLLALTNFVHDGVVRRWFHSDPRVLATELLLHEKPIHHAGMAENNARNTIRRARAVLRPRFQPHYRVPAWLRAHEHPEAMAPAIAERRNA